MNSTSSVKSFATLLASSSFVTHSIAKGFPGSSSGKESACNAGNPSSIPGSERSPGEGMGYLLQYSWVSLVAQMVNNLPAMRETWLRPQGWEDPLEEGMAALFSTLAQRIPMNNRSAWWATVHGSESQTRLSDEVPRSTASLRSL